MMLDDLEQKQIKGSFADAQMTGVCGLFRFNI